MRFWPMPFGPLSEGFNSEPDVNNVASEKVSIVGATLVVGTL